jgi:hypothetical protein
VMRLLHDSQAAVHRLADAEHDRFADRRANRRRACP